MVEVVEEEEVGHQQQESVEKEELEQAKVAPVIHLSDLKYFT